MTDRQDSPPETDSTDTLFRRMIIVSTALSLMAAYGWLAGFARQPGGDFSFQWRWNTLLWAFIGFGSNAYFWRKVWPVAGRTAATRKDIIKGSRGAFAALPLVDHFSAALFIRPAFLGCRHRPGRGRDGFDLWRLDGHPADQSLRTERSGGSEGLGLRGC